VKPPTDVATRHKAVCDVGPGGLNLRALGRIGIVRPLRALALADGARHIRKDEVDSPIQHGKRLDEFQVFELIQCAIGLSALRPRLLRQGRQRIDHVASQVLKQRIVGVADSA